MTQSSRYPRPKSGEARPYRFPAFERRALAGGSALIAAPVRKLPLATLALIVEAGAVTDPSGRDGISQLTSDLLLEGTASLSGAELTERLESFGADVDVVTDWDVTTITLTALRDTFEPAVRLLGEVLRAPAFPAREVDRLKGERRAELMLLRSEPRGLADVMFTRVLYPENSRFSKLIGGSEKSVAAISVDDIRAHHESRFRAGGVTAIVAGDVSADEAEKIVASALAGWRGGKPPAVTTVDSPARPTRALHIVDKPDAQQVELRIGHVGVPRLHDGYFGTTIMNAVLGGLFSSRINLNLREKHGYTYGASSRYDWRRQAGPFSVSSAVQTDATAAATREVLAEIDRIRAAEIDDSELSLATSYLDGLFPIRFETTEAIAGALAPMASFGLPNDYYDTYRPHVRGVTAKDVLTAARTHLHPEALQVLVVGDASKVRGELEAMQFGPLTMHEADDL